MQEEVENRTLTLVVNGTKFTGRLFKAAICKYLAHCKEKKLNKQRKREIPVKPQGKQTVKQLVGQNQGVSNIEITDPSIKEFEKIARKYGVDYAVKKDRSTSPPKYLIFFKEYKQHEYHLHTERRLSYPEHHYPQDQAHRTLRQTSQGVFRNAPPDTVQ